MKKLKLLLIIVTIFISLVANAQFIKTDKTVYYTGETIKVEFKARVDYASSAWIGIIPSHVPHGSEAVNDQHDVASKELNMRLTGKDNFKAPMKPGKYDLRMHNSAREGKEVASVTVEVIQGKNGSGLVNIAGVWKSRKNEDSHIQIYQFGKKVTMISSWPDDKGIWRTFMGEGMLDGREFKLELEFASVTASPNPAKYVYYLTVKDDDTEITGYFTRNGERAGTDSHLYRLSDKIGVVATSNNSSIEDRWVIDDRILSIKGGQGKFEYIRKPSTWYGIKKVGDVYLDNIVKTGDKTWNCSSLWRSGGNVKWSHTTTLTLSDDDNSLTLKTKSPFDGGVRSGTYKRKEE